MKLTVRQERAIEREVDREMQEEDERYWQAQREAREAERAERSRESIAGWQQHMLTPEIVTGLARLEQLAQGAQGDPAVQAALQWIVRLRDKQAESDQAWLKSIVDGWWS